jgi:hypothetical protein
LRVKVTWFLDFNGLQPSPKLYPAFTMASLPPSRACPRILFLPTGMTFGPDGNLYVSNVGFGPPPVGLGAVLKIAVPAN